MTQPMPTVHPNVPGEDVKEVRVPTFDTNDPKYVKAVSKTLSRMILRQPWFASLALRLDVRIVDNMDTAGVDGVHLFVNGEWFHNLSPDHQVSVMAHEVMHCALLHMTRRGSRNAFMWNVAGDYVINLELVECGFQLPKGCLLDKKYAGLSTEQVYATLKEQYGDGQDGQGQGSGKGKGKGGKGKGKGIPDFTDIGGVMDAPKDKGAEDQGGEGGLAQEKEKSYSEMEEDWNIATSQASIVASKAGNIPGSIDRAIKANQSKTDWRAVLQKFLVSTGDYSWARPNRRFLGGSNPMVLPGPIPDRPGYIVIAVDTSGSIYGELLNQFAGETKAILDAAGWPEKVVILYCDAKIQGVEECPDREIVFNAKGGGGTACKPVFKWVAKQGEDPLALFYLTDLEIPDMGQVKAPGYSVLWVTPECQHPYYGQPPFGEVVSIPAVEGQ